MMQPQITLDSPFGRALVACAAECETILEIGTGSGLGSTQCLLSNPNAIIRTVEANPTNAGDASNSLLFDSHRPSPIYVFGGVIHRTVKPFWHPDQRIQTQMREAWAEESEFADQCLLVDMGKWSHDMILFDGGEFTSDGDFLTLWRRAGKFIALDDTHPARSVKNTYARMMLERSMEWRKHATGDDRNGWAIFRKV